MQLDGGLGDIVAGSKNIPLYRGDSSFVFMTATRHHNNKDAWLVTVRRGHVLKYLAYRIDSTGIDTIPVESQSTLPKPIWLIPPLHIHEGHRLSENIPGWPLPCLPGLPERGLPLLILPQVR